MAESVIDVLIRLRDQTTQALRKLKTELDGTNKGFDKLGKADTQQTETALERLKNDLASIKTETDKSVASMKKLGEASAKIAAVGAGITAAFVGAARSAGTFQTQIQEIATLIPDAVQTTEQLRESVLSLSNEFGSDRADVASALYQAISSGARGGAEANDVLRVALITARGGVTDVRSAVDGLTTI